MDTLGKSVLSIVQRLSLLQSMGSLSIVERLSTLQSVHYWRFHCIQSFRAIGESCLVCPVTISFTANSSSPISERRQTLYVGMARVKSHVIRVKNTSKLRGSAWLGLQNSPGRISGLISTYR